MLIMSKTSFVECKVSAFIEISTFINNSCIEIQKLVKRNMATDSNVIQLYTTEVATGGVL